MALSRIVMRLARNPGTEFADGDDHRGYTLTATLGADGKLDPGAAKGAAVRRFAPDDDVELGVLKVRSGQWSFDFDGEVLNVPHLGDHAFAVGEYVSLPDDDGRLLAYKVTDVLPA